MSQVIVRILAQDLTGTGLNQADSKIKGIGTSAQFSAAKLALLGTIAVRTAEKAVSAFADFDKRIAEITTLLDSSTNKEFRQLSNEVESMSIRFGQSVDKMAKARYDIVSAGFRDIAESANIMQQSAVLAVGGVAQVSDTADVMTSVLNAFRGSNLDAKDAADTLFTTVRLGKTTMTELSHTMGRMVAIAPTVHVKFSELSAAFATLTQIGQKTEEATTALRQTMLAFVKPSKDMEKRINELGFASGASLIKSVGFADALKLVTQNADEAQLGKLFRNIRAFQAAVPLATNASQRFAENLDLMGKRAGSAQAAFEIMEQRISFKISQIEQRFAKFFRAVGAQIADWILAFFKLDDGIQNLIITLGLLGVAWKVAGGPITLLIGLAYLFYQAWDQNIGGVRTRLLQAWDEIKFQALQLVDFVKTIGNMLAAIGENGFVAGIAVAETEYEAFLATSDVKLKEHIENQNKILAENPITPFNWADLKNLMPDFASMFQADNAQLEDLGKKYATTFVNPIPEIYAKTWDNINKKFLGDVKVTTIKETQIKIAGVTEWEHFQTQAAQRIGQQMINLVGSNVASQISKAMKGMIGETKTFFGSLFATILEQFVSMLASMTARWLAFKAATFLLGGVFGLFFSQGGRVPARAQTGLRVGTDTVPALLTPGETVISRQNTKKNLPAINQIMGGQRPTGGGGGGEVMINNNFTINAIDAQGVSDFINSNEFRRQFITAINQKKLKLVSGNNIVQGAF